MKKSSSENLVSFRLMDKVYEVSCPAKRREAFNKCVDLFHNKAQQIAGSDPNLATDRLAVLTALNLGHDLLSMQQKYPDELESRLQALSTHMEETLDQARKQKLL